MDAVSLVAYIIAVSIPALAIYMIYFLDLFGTGKGSTIFICLGWGAIGAFGLSYVINTETINILRESYGLTEGSEAFRFVSSRTAPIVEEIAKAIVLIYFIQQPRFRYFVDGAIYGFAAGVGFAMMENIFYINQDSSGAALSLAVSRVLSASMMHATASAVAGICFGLSRRTANPAKSLVPIFGIFLAIVMHAIYNNVLFVLEGSGIILLIVAISIGLGGGVVIAFFINNGVEAEKRRFEETLGIASGISSAERRAVQKLGSDAIEEILGELAVMFGDEKASRIREMLVIQANMGILKNNMNSPASERLKEAWQRDIDELRAKMDAIRKELGTYIMTLLRNLLEDETADWNEFSNLMAENDPSHVHAFDLFMNASRVTGTISLEQLEDMAERISKVSFFQNVDLHELENLSRAITIRNFSHGERIFEQGDEGDAMYLIDRGYIDIFIKGHDSVLRTFEKGDIVGELALLDGQPRSASARAQGPLRVMILQRQHFMMFIQSRPRVILALLEFLSEKVRYTTAAISGDEQNIEVRELEEETTPLAPIRTDSIQGSLADLGVFGRLSRALDELEMDAIAEADKESNE